MMRKSKKCSTTKRTDLDPFALIVGAVKLWDGAEVDSTLLVASPRPAKRIFLEVVNGLVNTGGVARLHGGVSGASFNGESSSRGHD